MAGLLHGEPRPRGRALLAFISLASIFVLAAIAIFTFSPDLTPSFDYFLQDHLSSGLKRQSQAPDGDAYLLGVGKADITSPVVEINFAGYADPEQVGTGLRQRLYSRAFIVGSVDSPKDRFAYLVIDTAAGDTAVRNGILEGVRALGGEYAVYTAANIAVTGTHSHSGPGAWWNYLLPQVTSLGFSKQSYQAIVDGAVLSIKRAHESLTEGYLDIGTTDIADGSINRSLWSYLANPEAERALYGTETDHTMTLLRFRRASDLKTTGVLTWYAVHGTSLLQNNTLVAGDNKGVAAWLLEREMARETDVAAPGFVAGFSQATVGDTTPNVLGAWCDDGSGQMCSLENSTCADGKSQSCRGRGPAFEKLDQGTSSCFEIGKRQYAGARTIMDSLDSESTPVSGTSVKSFHFFHNMAFSTFDLPDGTKATTCPAALGYSFAAGTTDGPGAFDFTQADSGEPDANPIWKVVSGLLRAPSKEQKECQLPKPVLLDVGEMSVPYPWTANIVDVQMLRVGQLVIVVSPSEVSTMAGRRWKKAVGDEVKGIIGREPVVMIGGPANSYAHYVVTPEEYGVQRYEGASTLYGQHTLAAYMNLTVSNAAYLAPDSTSSPPPGPQPPDNRDKAFSFITGVVQDNPPIGRSFGQCIEQPKASSAIGSVVRAKFVAANPRNNLRLEGTYAAVEKKGSDGVWSEVRGDADWFLTFTWTRKDWLLGTSEVVLEWDTAEDGQGGGVVEAGEYRFRYAGDSKNLLGKISAFKGWLI
ncbi:probable neutral ceramidase precursor [Cephalotrichum gorgonifer]|uniref:Neutral ceramidase n=1 Tax=Cephalotrichum gorgonifer TaxID=2041049 RepID=A0AAE8SXJ6_9PEZI|nr:probable neutral ceramidase precursor [Cephalotrichum gorgonifer]